MINIFKYLLQNDELRAIKVDNKSVWDILEKNSSFDTSILSDCEFLRESDIEDKII